MDNARWPVKLRITISKDQRVGGAGFSSPLSISTVVRPLWQLLDHATARIAESIEKAPEYPISTHIQYPKKKKKTESAIKIQAND